MAINLWLGLYSAPNEWPWTYGFLVIIQSHYILDPPGRSLGVDAILRQRRRLPALLARIIHRTARNRPRPPNTWARDFIAKNFIKQPIRIVVNDIKGLALTAHFS